MDWKRKIENEKSNVKIRQPILQQPPMTDAEDGQNKKKLPSKITSFQSKSTNRATVSPKHTIVQTNNQSTQRVILINTKTRTLCTGLDKKKKKKKRTKKENYWKTNR